MKSYKVWIDGDPGVDDAAALILAAKMPQIEVVGVSATAGNVELDYTYENARNIVEYAGLDVPVYKGADRPLIRPPHYAKEIHGEKGLGGQSLPSSTAPQQTMLAWDALHEAAVKNKGELILVFIGPLTNLALALKKYPDLPVLAPRLILMGGSASFGNTTPSAEFNILFDPDAAALVFAAGFDLSMLGLDVTMQADLNRDDLARLALTGGEYGRFLSSCQNKTLDWLETLGLTSVAMHDPCTLLYLVYPDMFESERAGVGVETTGLLTYGRTVTDLYSDFQFDEQNADVVLSIDHARFLETFFAIIDGDTKQTTKQRKNR